MFTHRSAALPFEIAMRKDGRTFSPAEPARQKLYRKFYLRTKIRLDRQDDVLMHLVQRIDKLQKRIEELEHVSSEEAVP